MNPNNCLRLRDLTWNVCLHQAYMSSLGVHVVTWQACFHLAYVSSTGVCILTWCTCRHLENMSSPRKVLFLARSKKKCAYHPVFKSIKSLDGDCSMDRCHYAVAFQGISISLSPETKLTTTRKRRCEGGLSWMRKYYRE